MAYVQVLTDSVGRQLYASLPPGDGGKWELEISGEGTGMPGAHQKLELDVHQVAYLAEYLRWALHHHWALHIGTAHRAASQ